MAFRCRPVFFEWSLVSTFIFLSVVNDCQYVSTRIYSCLSAVSCFKLAHNGRRYGKCGIKLLLNCQPAQMYVKISNVSTNTQLSEAVS